MKKIIDNALWFVGLLFLQILILNRIHWFGVAMPCLYIYFILTTDTSLSRNKLILLSFALGLCIDILSNTFGIHAAASTLIAFLRSGIIRLFCIRDRNDYFVPSTGSMGTGRFLQYALTCAIVHQMVVYLLTYFTLSQPLQLVMHIVASVLITLLFVICTEFIRYHKL